MRKLPHNALLWKGIDIDGKQWWTWVELRSVYCLIFREIKIKGRFNPPQKKVFSFHSFNIIVTDNV